MKLVKVAGRAGAATLLALLGMQCQHPTDAPTPLKDASPPAPPASQAAAPHASAEPPVDELAAYRTSAPLSGKSIGHTSVVFKLELEGGLTAAWKPRSRRGQGRYKGEIAAYRLASALGLSNVPPAIPREIELRGLNRALGASPASTLLTEEALADDLGMVPGALIPWIVHLGFMPLEQSKPEWRAWLGTGSPPPEKRQLAADISTMIAFDYMTANWDRWSGGNVGVDPKSGRLLFIDNDAAFFEAPPTEPLLAMKKQLLGVTKFSRSFVAKVRALDLVALEAAMGREGDGRPLLTSSVLAGVMKRRSELLAIIDARGPDGLAFE